MNTDCFAYNKRLRNKCSALKGAVNCFECCFYKTREKYYDEIKKMEIRCNIVRNKQGLKKKVDYS